MIIHVLHQGRALCGRPDVPSQWNEDEQWVRLEDTNLAGAISRCGDCFHFAEHAFKKSGWVPPAVAVEKLAIEDAVRELRDIGNAGLDPDAALEGFNDLKRRAQSLADTLAEWLL